MKKYYFLLAFTMQLLGFRIASAEMNIGDILNLHKRNYLNTHETVYYEASAEKTFKSSAPINGMSENCSVKFCQNGNDIDVNAHRITLNQNLALKSDYFNRYVMLNQEFIDYNYKYNETPSYISIDGRKDMVEDYQKRSILFHLGLGRLLDGYYIGLGNRTIAEFLQSEPEIDIKKSKDILNGHEVVLLECDSKYGNMKLWLDPEFGFNMRKMVLTKEAGDIYVDELLEKRPTPLPDGAVSSIPHAAIKTIELIFDSVELKKIDDSYVIISASIKENTYYQNGEYLEETVKCSINNISFEPDFEKLRAFELGIPDGTRVIFRDERGINGVEYEWFDGKPRAKVDDSFLDLLNDSVGKIRNEIELPIAKSEKAAPSCKLSQNDINQVDVKKDTIRVQEPVADKSLSVNSNPFIFLVTAVVFVAGIAVIWLIYRRRA